MRTRTIPKGGMLTAVVSVAAIAGAFMTWPAAAAMVCSDLDGDGVAETCIEVDEGGARFPGESPPPVPDPGEGVPIEE